MNLRIFSLRKGLSLVSIGRRKFGFDRPHCDPHMNELPTPTEPWSPNYSKKQAGYNKILLFGISSFVLSAYIAITNDCVNGNFRAPYQPAEPSEIRKDLNCDT